MEDTLGGRIIDEIEQEVGEYITKYKMVIQVSLAKFGDK